MHLRCWTPSASIPPPDRIGTHCTHRSRIESATVGSLLVVHRVLQRRFSYSETMSIFIPGIDGLATRSTFSQALFSPSSAGPHGTKYPVGHSSAMLLDFVFPESKNSPALLFQKPVDRDIPVSVLLKLGIPELRVRFRPHPMCGAGVPLATVHENRNLFPRENQIGLSGDLRFEAISQPHCPQVLSQQNFRFGITSVDLRHAVAALGRR